MTYSYASGRHYYDPATSEFMSSFAPEYHNLGDTLSYVTNIKNLSMVFYVSADNITNTTNILGYRYSFDGSQRTPVLPPTYRTIFLGMNISINQFKKEEL